MLPRLAGKPWSSAGTIWKRRSPDRKSTRLNSSHLVISYAVFCLKKTKELANAFLWLHLTYLDRPYLRPDLQNLPPLTRRPAPDLAAHGFLLHGVHRPARRSHTTA